MNWEQGYRASYHAAIVDPSSWLDAGRFEITDGSISRNDDGLRQSADITTTNYDTSVEQYIRIYLETRQGDNGDRVALFTGLATSPDVDYEGDRTTNSLQCYSVLKAAEDIHLDLGWYILKGSDGASAIRKLLSVCPCPIEVNGEGPKLQNTIVAEDDENCLSMTEKILEAIDWRLRITGEGVIQILPKQEKATPIEPSATFVSNRNDILEPKITLSADWFDCPNVFRAVSNDISAIARDEDPDSKFSIPSRGREIWMEDSDCDFNEDETIAEYAARMLKEEQNYYITAKYDRRFMPDLLASDVIFLDYPKQELFGYYRITSQTISLTHAASTSEEVIYVG